MMRKLLLSFSLLAALLACDDPNASGEGDLTASTGNLADVGVNDGLVEMDGGDVDSMLATDATIGSDFAADMSPPETLSLNSIVPNRGDVSGGTPLRIVGAGFTEQTRFEFGGEPCTEVTIETSNRASCISPLGAMIGAVDVVVTRAFQNERSTVTAEDAFTYFVPLSITGISPDRVTTAGGVPVLIYGTGFTDTTEVRVDNLRQSGVQITSATELSFIAPEHDDGTVIVSVRNVDGMAETTLIY